MGGKPHHLGDKRDLSPQKQSNARGNSTDFVLGGIDKAASRKKGPTKHGEVPDLKRK